MNYKKQFEGIAKAIITDAYIFPNFKPGELPAWKFYSPVVAWDTGADLDEYAALFGMDIITMTDFLITNADEKTTFQFRTPSEGGVKL